MTTKKSIPCLFSLLCVALSMLCGCYRNDKASIMPETVHLQEGDVVFRLGTTMQSRAVVLADPMGNYSHCGIVVDSAGATRIVHAVPGEPDFECDVGRVKMDTPERFFSGENAVAGEVCRPLDSLVAHVAAAEAKADFFRHVLFDHDYESADTTKFYCSEFLVHVFRKAGVELTGPPTHSYDVPGLHSIIWMPIDIYQSKYLKSVVRF